MIRFLFLLFFTAPLFGFQVPVKKDKEIQKMLDEAGKHFNQSEFKKALGVSKNALSLSLKGSNDYYTAHAYNAIGAVYNEYSQSERAIEFYKKALKHAKKVENDSLLDWINSNIGSVYYYNEIDVPKGIAYYKNSLYYAEKINDSIQIGFARLNIASAYFSIEKFQEGIAYLQPIRNYLEVDAVAEAKISYLSLMANYQSHLGNSKSAESIYFKAIEIAEIMNMKGQLFNLYECLAVHFQQQGQLSLYRVYKSKNEALGEELYSSDSLRELDDTANQIELDEYKAQLEKIELQNEVQHKKIKESNTLVILFYSILVILLILIYTLYKTNKSRKKINHELIQANAALVAAKNKAEENALLKTQFVSTVSHELRTPLYGVVGIANIILEENRDMVNADHLNSLRFSARYLLALVNDILEMHKIEENKIVMEQTKFNLDELISTINKSLQFIADTNGNELEFVMDPSIPDALIGDELRLSQILMNLISNALKFTENGKVSVVVQLHHQEAQRFFILFEVIDNGIGIKEEYHQMIFDKFVQIERQRGDYKGTGLGLSIVKKLIDLFGSSIQMESQENVGTKFSFMIGFDAHLPKDSFIHKKQSLKAALKILVVEDNKINQMVTRKIIERYHHQCVLVESGREAIAIVEQETFDVILMDINMPIMDGYETSKGIRALGVKIPIVALTAYDRKEVLEQAHACGIDDVIIKPFETDELFEVIRKLLVKE